GRGGAGGRAVGGLGVCVGGLLVPVLAGPLACSGWRPVAIGSGVLCRLLAWRLGRVLVSEPEAMGLRPDGEKAAASEAPGSGADQAGGNGAPVGARSALRTREFWLLSVGHGNALAIVGAVSVHFVIYVGETIGLGVTTAAAMFTLITVCQIAGQAAGGFL